MAYQWTTLDDGRSVILSKIMWLVISGLIMAFVAFVIGGGLKSL